MSDTETREIVHIGVECFAATDGSVLCWRGVNYVPQGGPVVHDAAPGEDCLGSPGCRACLARDLAAARAETARLRGVVEAVRALARQFYANERGYLASIGEDMSLEQVAEASNRALTYRRAAHAIEETLTPSVPSSGETGERGWPSRAGSRRLAVADVTTPDSRPVLDVIADVVEDVLDVYDTVMHVHSEAQAIAAAVLAACQGATVEQQAELIGAETTLESSFGDARRVLGPWREDPS